MSNQKLPCRDCTKWTNIKYDPNVDYCGPEGSKLARFIPNRIWGVSVNVCCYIHDQEYHQKVGKDVADQRFRSGMYSKVCRAFGRFHPLRYASLIRATTYWLFVKYLGQWAYKGSKCKCRKSTKTKETR